MRTSVDHLPKHKQLELEYITQVLLKEMDNLNGNSSKFLGRVEKIILFGSHTGDKWVDDATAGRGVGYQSDYDILLIVNYERFADPSIWTPATDALRRAPEIGPPVQVIVHSMPDIIQQLREGRYFFKDIRKEGIVLYDAWHGKGPLPEPGNLTPQETYDQAVAYYQANKELADNFYDHYLLDMEKKKYSAAAFQLHQSTEFAYRTLLLTRTLYVAKGHNLENMRALAEQYDERLIAIWPRDRKRFRRYFVTLNRAYVEARYSPHFKIEKEVCDWLDERNTELREGVYAFCNEYIAQLRGQL